MTKDVTVNNRFSSNIQTPQSSNEILRFIINSGMINIDDVQDSMEAMKREELLKKHPYKIWQGKDGEWYTKLVDENGSKKLRHRKTLKDLENVVIEHIRKTVECPTVESIFHEWINIRLDRGEIEKSTYSRYERDLISQRQKQVSGML